MKVLVSPSKTMAYDNLFLSKTESYQGLSPLAKELFCILKSLSHQQLKALYKASDSVVDDAVKKLNETGNYKAIELFNGAVFKNLDYPSLSKVEQDYIGNNVSIFSAIYGAIPANASIKPYRLDLNNSLKPEIVNLTGQWKKDVNDYLNSFADELIIDLASTEYRKLIDYKNLKTNCIVVDFKDFKDGKFKTVGTYAKMARGQFLRAMAKENVTTINHLKALSIMNYSLNEDLSNDCTFIYTRK